MVNVFRDTEEFGRSVIGLDRPDYPRRLSPERKAWLVATIIEELGEFISSNTLHDECDALIDLMYFAAGRFHEMGVNGEACWKAVHDANMLKELGRLAKRPDTKEGDAIKPEGWRPPDLQHVISQRKKLCVLGYARSGKDTVCEVLRDDYGYSFTSSSLFAAKEVVRPYLEQRGIRYSSVEACFNDRGNHRKFWYDAICKYNEEDPARLGKQIMLENDIYCGIRSWREFYYCQKAGLFDHVIWVDASKRGVPVEPSTSCTIERGMADAVIFNNEPKDEVCADLRRQLAVLAKEIGL